jgi:hypothetical protein
VHLGMNAIWVPFAIQNWAARRYTTSFTHTLQYE